MTTVQIMQALLTPLIAIIATYIAYQQWNTNKLKLKLDRYERRLRVYQKIVELVSKFDFASNEGLTLKRRIALEGW